MEITKIPFVEKVGIQKNQEGQLFLDFDKSVQNHLKTIHGSALFTLAESASGEILKTLFPDLIGKVIPVLRDSQIKFKKPATKKTTAFPFVSNEEKEKFKEQLNKKGRASLAVNVELKDSDDILIFIGTFGWFIQGVT